MIRCESYVIRCCDHCPMNSGGACQHPRAPEELRELGVVSGLEYPHDKCPMHSVELHYALER